MASQISCSEIEHITKANKNIVPSLMRRQTINKSKHTIGYFFGRDWVFRLIYMWSRNIIAIEKKDQSVNRSLC